MMVSDYEQSVIVLTTTVLAYVMNADGDDMKPEERARLMTFLGKYVSQDMISQRQVKEIVAEAQETIRVVPFRKFVESKTLLDLYPGQKLAVFINAMDASLVDDRSSGGQTEALDILRRALDIDLDTSRAIQKIFLLKNSSAVLADILHPTNASQLPIRVRLFSA